MKGATIIGIDNIKDYSHSSSAKVGNFLSAIHQSKLKPPSPCPITLSLPRVSPWESPGWGFSIPSWEDHERNSEGWAKIPPPHWKCAYGKMYYNHIIINSLLHSHPTTTYNSQFPVFAHGVHFSHKIGSPAEPCPGDRFSQANIPHNNLLFEIQNKINTATRNPLQKKTFFHFFRKTLAYVKKKQ